MTPFKNFSKNPTWKHRVRRGGLYVAVAAMLAVHAGCSDNGQDWEEVTVQEPTKGVVTTVEETEPGKFSIVNEEVVSSKALSHIIVRRLNGATDTLTLNQAKSLIQVQDTAGTAYGTHYHTPTHSLGNVLWWSAMGYMMGRGFNTPVNPIMYRREREEEQKGGTSGGGGYAYGRSYRSGSDAAEELKRTSVSRTVLRPVSGKSGFFKGSSRGRSGG